MSERPSFLESLPSDGGHPAKSQPVKKEGPDFLENLPSSQHGIDYLNDGNIASDFNQSKLAPSVPGLSDDPELMQRTFNSGMTDWWRSMMQSIDNIDIARHKGVMYEAEANKYKAEKQIKDLDLAYANGKVSQEDYMSSKTKLMDDIRSFDSTISDRQYWIDQNNKEIQNEPMSEDYQLKSQWIDSYEGQKPIYSTDFWKYQSGKLFGASAGEVSTQLALAGTQWLAKRGAAYLAGELGIPGAGWVIGGADILASLATAWTMRERETYAEMSDAFEQKYNPLLDKNIQEFKQKNERDPNPDELASIQQDTHIKAWEGMNNLYWKNQALSTLDAAQSLLLFPIRRAGFNPEGLAKAIGPTSKLAKVGLRAIDIGLKTAANTYEEGMEEGLQYQFAKEYLQGQKDKNITQNIGDFIKDYGKVAGTVTGLAPDSELYASKDFWDNFKGGADLGFLMGGASAIMSSANDHMELRKMLSDLDQKGEEKDYFRFRDKAIFNFFERGEMPTLINHIRMFGANGTLGFTEQDAQQEEQKVRDAYDIYKKINKGRLGLFQDLDVTPKDREAAFTATLAAQRTRDDAVRLEGERASDPVALEMMTSAGITPYDADIERLRNEENYYKDIVRRYATGEMARDRNKLIHEQQLAQNLKDETKLGAVNYLIGEKSYIDKENYDEVSGFNQRIKDINRRYYNYLIDKGEDPGKVLLKSYEDNQPLGEDIYNKLHFQVSKKLAGLGFNTASPDTFDKKMQEAVDNHISGPNTYDMNEEEAQKAIESWNNTFDDTMKQLQSYGAALSHMEDNKDALIYGRDYTQKNEDGTYNAVIAGKLNQNLPQEAFSTPAQRMQVAEREHQLQYRYAVHQPQVSKAQKVIDLTEKNDTYADETSAETAIQQLESLKRNISNQKDYEGNPARKAATEAIDTLLEKTRQAAETIKQRKADRGLKEKRLWQSFSEEGLSGIGLNADGSVRDEALWNLIKSSIGEAQSAKITKAAQEDPASAVMAAQRMLYSLTPEQKTVIKTSLEDEKARLFGEGFRNTNPLSAIEYLVNRYFSEKSKETWAKTFDLSQVLEGAEGDERRIIENIQKAIALQKTLYALNSNISPVDFIGAEISASSNPKLEVPTLEQQWALY